MKLSEIDLPSNRRFGAFFTFVFVIAAAYFYHAVSISVAYVFGAVALIFFLITSIQSDALLPLNRLWIRFGIKLGFIVSPIVLGIIFFGLFTPIALFMRLSGRDELRLNRIRKTSHWVTRGDPINPKSFEQQF